MSSLKHTLRRITHRSSKDRNTAEARSNGHAGSNGHIKVPKPLANLVISSSSQSSLSNGDNDGTHLSKTQRKKEEKRQKKEERQLENEKRRKSFERRQREEEKQAERNEPAELRARYGDLPLVHRERHNAPSSTIAQLSKQKIGDTVALRARIHTLRNLSSHLVFLVFRQGGRTLQGVLQEEEGEVTHHMVKWVERLAAESIVLVKGVLQRPKEEIRGASEHHFEILIRELHVISRPTESLPMHAYEADASRRSSEDGDEKDQEEDSRKSEDRRVQISDRARLNNRLIDLRTPTANAIFKVNSGICNLFRSFLDSHGFIEIHTPKLQGGATESGASVFQLEYFGRPAFLAQSPQLAKQMSISADFEKVYEVGPVFRAENSNTHRHLTEYTGLDLEMAIDEHYHEALDLIDATLKHIWKGLYDRFGREMSVIKRQFPHEDLVWLDKTPVLPFKEGIKLLRESGWTDEEGNPPSEFEDLHTRDEIRLGQLMKEKYHTDYYILDKFPASARPFYTMPDPDDDRVTNSFDIFLRGQEILSGGQRIHGAKMLEAHMDKQGIKKDGMEEYLDGFRWGAPPHAGGGLGLERIVMLLLNLGNIRLASLFPRDPKSFPVVRKPAELRYPEADTLHPPWKNRTRQENDYQPLEKLIANYGDASNTSWLDDRFRIWRDEETGAAVAYVPQGKYGIIPGDPLCAKSQYHRVMTTFLKWIKKEKDLKPLWILCGHDTEEVLGGKLGWSTLTCAAEQRVDPGHNPDDSDLKRKIKHAEKSGIKIIDVPSQEGPSDEIKQKCDVRIQDWHANRKGTQVHLTKILPWRDQEHRRYFYAQGKDSTIHALVVLAQLAPEHGYQVKFALDFPHSPNGVIESLILHAIQSVKQDGEAHVTFGGGAMSRLEAGHNLGGVRVKLLQESYKAIVTRLKLTQKSEFREKLGAVEDPTFVCFPKRGLGQGGIRAIMRFFEEDDQ
ncbi:MAG: aspartyl-tRNA synthetase [Lasallia pustulata]|uniref:Aspartate--tRNA ligase, cytoplasmic n=1 Tax=Lasallia pustulata TaxID=136370 RepID=A0A5M8PS65_9LECA|nr:MAG: aspartyl-tRNA synthetase [Lasallia pustulata]